MTQQTTDWMADLMLDRVEIVPGVSAAVVVVVVASEAVGRISRLGLCSPMMREDCCPPVAGLLSYLMDEELLTYCLMSS